MADFSHHIRSLCKSTPKALALPESLEERTLSAGYLMLREELVSSLFLFGSPDLVRAKAKEMGCPLAEYENKIHWVHDDKLVLGHYQKWLQEEYKTKSPDPEKEKKEIQQNALYQAGYYLRMNLVHAAVAGAESTTADVIRAALKTIGMTNGIDTLSGSFVFVKRKARPFIFADCAVVVNPTAEQLSQIAYASADTWEKIFKKEGPPQVAFLSFSTKGSAQHEEVKKVQEAVAIFQKQHPRISCDGELQFDAALRPEVGERKGLSAGLSGNFNCYVFPDLNAGNIAYKIAQHLAGYEAFGPILQGLAKPYSDLSRGASIEDIITTSCLAMLRA